MNKQSNPVLTEMREGTRFVRTIASFVIFVFSFVMYSPSALAIVHSKTPDKPMTAKERYDNSFERRAEQLKTALENFNRELASIKDAERVGKLSWVSEIKSEIIDDALLDARLKVIETWEVFNETQQQAIQKEEQIEERLEVIKDAKKRQKLVEKQLAKHKEILAKYEALEKKVIAIKDAPNGKALKKSAYDALRFLAQNNPEQTAHIYNAGEMPFGVSSDAQRSPYRTEPALHEYLGLDYEPGLDHANQGFNIFQDFNSTPEIDKNHPDIQALADELGRNAKNIYTWVYNNIYYIPSFGSIQGSVQTLHNRQGNAFDISSLLIALLRASNIPARYVYGTVLLSADQVNNWVGGVDNIQSARVVMAQGGIPGSAVSYGGRHEKLRFEHVWVEAFGTFGQEGRLVWNPMDAAYKQYNYTEGVDLLSEVGFDAEQFQETVENAGTVNEAEGWIANVDSTNMQAQLTQYQDSIQAYLSNLPEDTTLAEVIGGQSIIEFTADELPALPYEEYVRTRSFSQLPDNLRHKFRVQLATKPSGIAGGISGGTGTLLMEYTGSLPELAGKDVALSFRPATAEDEEIVAALFGNAETVEDMPAEIDAGLFDVIGEVTVDGEVVANTENPIAFGTVLATHKGFIDPRFAYRNTTSPITAGDYQAIGIDLQGITVEQMQSMQSNLEAVYGQLLEQNLDGLTKHDVAGGIMQAGIQAYFALNDTMTKLAAKMNGLVHYRMPSFGTFSTHSQVAVFWGAANKVTLGGMAMDIDWLMANNEGKVNCWQDWVAFNQMVGQMASAYEHVIPEQLLSTDEQPVEFISTMKALQIANAEGQRMYTINQDNIGTLLPQIEADSQIKKDIQRAVAAGQVATIHERPIEYQDYVGSGYILLDSETGAGAYKISGGGNGSVNGIAFFIGILFAVFGMATINLGLMAVILFALPYLFASMYTLWALGDASSCFWAGFSLVFTGLAGGMVLDLIKIAPHLQKIFYSIEVALAGVAEIDPFVACTKSAFTL